MEDKLSVAIAKAEEGLAKNGVPVKGGKSYLMVVHRINIFREVFGLSLGIETKVLHHCDDWF